MKKIIITILALVLLALPVMANQNNPIEINRFFVQDYVQAGSPFHVLANIRGGGSLASERVKVRASLLDFGTQDSDGPQTIGSFGRTANMLVSTPVDAESGWYLLRLSIRDKDGNRRTKHRFVQIN